jgi:cytochrome c biogenesis protein CcdA
MRYLKLAIIVFLSATTLLQASTRNLEILFFTEPGCAECDQLHAFFERRIVDFYPVALIEKDVRKPADAALLMDLARLCGSDEIRKQGAPAVFIADSAFAGGGERVRNEIEEAVRARIFSAAPTALERLAAAGGRTQAIERLRLSAIFGAALADAVNPCAFAVLTLLLGSLLSAARRRRTARLIRAGLAFTLAVFICYTLIGFGILHALQLARLQSTIYALSALLAFVVGLWNLKDALLPDFLPRIEVPSAWQRPIDRIVRGVSSAPGAFMAGAIVSWLLLPCTSGPYLVALGMLSESATRGQALVLILIYNLIFVLPFLLITALLALGFARPYQIERWRQSHKRSLHLATALLMLALAFILLRILMTQ